MFRILLWIVVIISIYFIGLRLEDSIKRYKKAKSTKRKLKAVWSFVFVPLMLVSLFGFYSYISFVYVDKGTQENAIKNYDVITDDYACEYQLTSTCEEIFNEMYWDKIPSSLKKVLKEDWTVIIDDEVPTSMQAPITVAANTYDKTEYVCGGLTYTQKRLIYVNYMLTDDWFINSYIHEHGHVVSYEYGTLHGTLEWKKLYYDNKDKAECDAYFVSDSAEFFAWSYAEYFQHPENLQKTLPTIYEYMDELNHTELNQDYKLLTGMKSLANTFLFHMI